MPASIPPTVRQRKLIASLKRLRGDAELSITDAARQLGFSQPKLSRLEAGAVRPKVTDVIALLDLYGVASPERDALLTLARDVDRRGWWTQYDDLFAGSFVALEDEAEKIVAWEPLLVPGLLQTEDYARAVISRIHMDEDPDGVHRRVVARMTRSMILRRPQPPTLHAIIGEAALRQQVGGAEVMRKQIDKLRIAADQDNITVQVVRFSADAHPGMEGAITLFSFADDADLDVVHAEGQGGPVYLEGQQVQRIRVGLRNVASAAMSADASRDLLESLAR